MTAKETSQAIKEAIIEGYLLNFNENCLELFDCLKEKNKINIIYF